MAKAAEEAQNARQCAASLPNRRARKQPSALIARVLRTTRPVHRPNKRFERGFLLMLFQAAASSKQQAVASAARAGLLTNGGCAHSQAPLCIGEKPSDATTM